MNKDELQQLSEETLKRVIDNLGGCARSNQQEMTQAVAKSLAEKRNLVVQAGTGVGKSIGYLTPLLLHAALSEQVQIVATSSLALQRQITSRDAPAVAEAVEEETGKAVNVQVLKGWSNYLCRLRLNQGDDALLWDDAYSGATGAEEVAALREWGLECESGDKDDVPFKVSPASWRQVSVSRRECIGRACPFLDECFPAAAKEKAFDADVIVTNHALLAVMVGGNPEIFPDFDAVVIDEAHDLASRVRTQGTVQLWPSQIRRLARVARSLSRTGAGDLEDASHRLEAALDDCAEGLVVIRSEQLSAAMMAVDDASRSLRSSIKGAKGATEEITVARVRAGLEGIDEVMDAWSREPEQMILWIGKSRNDERYVNIAPLAVSPQLYSTLFSQHTTVLTSATLSVGGNFEQIKWASGIGRGECDYLDVGTPFDPGKQGILYVAAHLADPGRDWPDDQALAELLALVEASGGGMLGLFSSWRAAEAATEFLRENTELAVLFQRDDNVPALVEEFRRDRDSCLIGTMSLWQGVDVPGDSCRLVVLDRIPFPRPDDPIVAAQQRAAERAGRSSFHEVSLAPAALALAQGAGRLLRGMDDRGVVAILDSRIHTRRYGQYLRNSLLPYWTSTHSDTVKAALRRLA